MRVGKRKEVGRGLGCLLAWAAKEEKKPLFSCFCKLGLNLEEIIFLALKKSIS
jgi:hypothetical protein